MNKYEITGKNLILDGTTIKHLAEHETEAAELITDILNNFNIECKDTTADQELFISEYTNKSDYSSEEIENLIIPLLLLDDYYNFKELLAAQDLEEFINRIDTTARESLYLNLQMDDFLYNLNEIFQVPSNLESYVDYDSIINDMEANSELTTYNLRHQGSDFIISRFMVEYINFENFIYELKI